MYFADSFNVINCYHLISNIVPHRICALSFKNYCPFDVLIFIGVCTLICALVARCYGICDPRIKMALYSQWIKWWRAELMWKVLNILYVPSCRRVQPVREEENG